MPEGVSHHALFVIPFLKLHSIEQMRAMSVYESEMLWIQSLHKMCSEEEALPLSSGGESDFSIGTVSLAPRLTFYTDDISDTCANWKRISTEVEALDRILSYHILITVP